MGSIAANRKRLQLALVEDACFVERNGLYAFAQRKTIFLVLRCLSIAAKPECDDCALKRNH